MYCNTIIVEVRGSCFDEFASVPSAVFSLADLVRERARTLSDAIFKVCFNSATVLHGQDAAPVPAVLKELTIVRGAVGLLAVAGPMLHIILPKAIVVYDGFLVDYECLDAEAVLEVVAELALISLIVHIMHDAATVHGPIAPIALVPLAADPCLNTVAVLHVVRASASFFDLASVETVVAHGDIFSELYSGVVDLLERLLPRHIKLETFLFEVLLEDET